MKKIITYLLIAVLSLSVVGCASKTTSVTTETISTEAFTGDYLVDATYVKENLDNQEIIFVDARGEEAAAKKTIKGAVAVAWQALATCEDGKSGDANWGCILDPSRLSERLSALGLAKDKEIILFAAAQNGWGDDGRIAWELLAAGYEKVKMVDGGFDALEAAGVETQKGGSQLEAMEVVIDAIDETHVINTDALIADYYDYKVVDVRADAEYEGEVLYGETKGGHLPSAIHIPFTDLFNADSTLKSKEDLTKMFTDAGLKTSDQIVTYCTAGIRSAYMQLVLEMCGYEQTQNYDESFYRWSAVEKVE